MIQTRCHAVLFRQSLQECYLLDRKYDAKFVAASDGDDAVVANRLGAGYSLILSRRENIRRSAATDMSILANIALRDLPA